MRPSPISRISAYVVAAAAVAVPATQFEAAPIDPNNILVAISRTGDVNQPGGAPTNSVREFKPDGTFVQEIPFPYGPRPSYPPTEYLRDIVVDPYGAIDAYNGTFNPFLSRFFTDSNTFSHLTFPGWSTFNSPDYGGIAAFRNFVYASDTYTALGRAKGIIRFDLVNHTAQRFAPEFEVRDLNVGVDGKLYALVPSPGCSEACANFGRINVYDPVTMALLRQITIPASITDVDGIQRIAVDQLGRIFLTGLLSRTIYRLSASGVLETSLNTGTHDGLQDIDIDESDRVILGAGTVVLVGDTSLTTPFISFVAVPTPQLEQWSAFVCFAHPVPEPVGPLPTPIPTPAPTPTPVPTHNIFVSIGEATAGSISPQNVVREFDPTGTLLRTIPFNYDNGPYPTNEYLRDIVIDQNGFVDAFNGTWNPFLTRYSLSSGAFTHSSFPQWNTTGQVAFGGIAAWQNFVYVTDMALYDPNGIVRFDTSTGTASRFANGTDFADLNIGLDGKLYALTSPAPNTVNVYDPMTMQLIAQVAIPTEITDSDFVNNIAADSLGRIYLAGDYGAIYRLTPNGALDASVATGWPGLRDIDIDETSRVICGQQDGYVIAGDTGLSSFSAFQALSGADGSYMEMSVAFGPLESISPFSLNVAATNGTVTKNPDQVDYPPGTQITLTATPMAGYEFTNWSGDASGSSNPLVITMDSNKNITANFAQKLPTVATPSISPNGGTYYRKVKVTLACATSGAKIYYTTDGSDPTTLSKLYKKVFRVKGQGPHTVKAKGVESGYNDSAVATADFTIN